MKRILIVGNPNTGKTSLFNLLTKKNEKVANYSGVTIKEKSAIVEFFDEKIELVDLPGVYSFDSLSEDEKVTKNFLENHKTDEVVFVCSSNNVNRNLILLTELIKQGYKLKIIINQMEKKLSKTEIRKLESLLSIPIYCGDVRKDRDLLLDWMVNSIASVIEKKIDIDKILDIFVTDKKILGKLDKVLLHRFWGKIVCLLIFSIIIVISYGAIGQGLSERSSYIIFQFGELVVKWIDKLGIKWLSELWMSVFVSGFGSVLIYLPQLFLMLFMLFILEEIGYLPRVGVVFNRILEKLGLNGKSIFSLVMGLGCTTSAVLTSRNIGEYQARKATVKFLPFIGCSAKIPIIIFISQVVLGGLSLIVVAGVYLTAIIIGLVYLYINKPVNVENDYFIEEIPDLKRPSLKRVTKQSLIIIIDLLKKISITVIVSTLIMWFLLNISVEFTFMSGGKSILIALAESFSIILKPLNLDRSDVVVALILGLVAKENIVSVMGLFNTASMFNVVQAITFLIFIALYSPCFAALKCARCELGKKFAVKQFLCQLLIAYVSSLIFSTFGRINVFIGALALIVFSLLAILFKKLIFKSKENKIGSKLTICA